ncbi:MAG: prepilin peptidase [Clostridia bacterium]|nr:prepilin peptidase [Clostridia bacterium]
MTLLILALISDIKYYKIKNVIVFPFILLGFATNILLTGLGGIPFSFYGTILPIIVLFILYALRMLGAGDIKLFSALGAIMGSKFIAFSMAYSFVSGGVIGVFILLANKNGIQRMKYLFQYLLSCLLSLKLFPYTDFEDKSDKAKFRFAYAIACGTIISLLTYK